MSTIVSRPTFKSRYDNFIGGKFTPPVKGEYFENVSPIDGKVFTHAARSGKEDIELSEVPEARAKDHRCLPWRHRGDKQNLSRDRETLK